jgi:hypothetical protein
MRHLFICWPERKVKIEHEQLRYLWPAGHSINIESRRGDVDTDGDEGESGAARLKLSRNGGKVGRFVRYLKYHTTVLLTHHPRIGLAPKAAIPIVNHRNSGD